MKLAHFLDQASVLTVARRSSRPKILVFLGTIMIVTLIMGSAMYVIDGAASGFTNIPRGVYWAIVTLRTVGYGDLYPQTNLGRLLASVVMVIGYAIIAGAHASAESESGRQAATSHVRPSARVGSCSGSLPMRWPCMASSSNERIGCGHADDVVGAGRLAHRPNRHARARDGAAAMRYWPASELVERTR